MRDSGAVSRNKCFAKEAFLKMVFPQRDSAAVLLPTLAGVSRALCMVQQIFVATVEGVDISRLLQSEVKIVTTLEEDHTESKVLDSPSQLVPTPKLSGLFFLRLRAR